MIQHGRQLERRFRKLIIPVLRDIAGDVRQKEANAQKERAVMSLVQLLDGPAGELPIPFVLIEMRKNAPVDQRMTTGCLHQ